ncbi:MAG: hypothetical protein ACREHE_07075 [Rhizomicrobium sp.]
MNRPSPFTYLIGNPLSLIGAWLLTAFLSYQWYANGGPGILPIITGIAAISASNAYARIDKYRLWKREWEAMNGVVTTGTVTGDLMQKPGFRFVIGGAIWCVFAYGALTIGNQPGGQTAAGLFWVGTLVLILGGLYRLVRRNRAPAAAKKAEIRDVPVTLCVKPQQSPSVSQAFAALPEYCAPLFERNESRNAPITH